MTDVDATLKPWVDALLADGLQGAEFFDAHTHIGRNDPDGHRQTPEQLLAALAPLDARAAVFPSMEPDGYASANEAAIEAASASGGKLVAYARIDPGSDDPLAETKRCLDAGARGLKLHPRAERFTLSHPGVRRVIAEAHERRVPVIIHAGRGIPALGRDTVHLSGEFPGARLILAHAAISDLAWLWKVIPEHPNLFVDTSWWNPVDLFTLFATVPPAHILWASDSPYGAPTLGAVLTGRCAVQAGLTPEQLRGVFNDQMERIVSGEDPLDLGPAPGHLTPIDPHLERVLSHLTGMIARAFVHADSREPLELARLSCSVGEDGPRADVHAAILELLDRYEEELRPPGDDSPFPAALRYIVVANAVARTPDVALPARKV